MPIKDLMTYAAGILAVLFLLHGPTRFRAVVRDLELRILRDATRTDNWGDPSLPFRRLSNHPPRNRPGARPFRPRSM